MSKNVAVFVDVANLYYSARGQDTDVDYVALLKAATKGRDLIRAYAYSGLDPENENQRKFIDFLNKNGYKVVHKDIRKFGDGRVKANLDIELVVDLFRLADRMDIAVIVSGDGDFAPAIRALQDKGVRCEVISFRPNTSSDLMAVADEFFDIMKIIGIGRSTKEKEKEKEKEPKASSKVMSAPEMPAKEVVPEFGFREASPSVAAAALAALREGRDTHDGRPASGRGRGRGRGRAEAPAAEEPAAEVAPSAAAAPSVAVASTNGSSEGTDGEGRRRRRRRGGRGRGRGRSRAEGQAAEGAATEPGEIGWVEVDDLSQIEELGPMTDLAEDREYTFEEADEATLAELGLLGETPAPAEAKPAPRRRTRAAKPAAEDSATTAETPAEAKPAPRRRTRAAKPAAEDSATAAETAAEEKPAPRRRTRAAKPAADAAPSEARPARSRSRATKATADAAPPGDGSEEGIWKRFRSARGKDKPAG